MLRITLYCLLTFCRWTYYKLTVDQQRLICNDNILYRVPLISIDTLTLSISTDVFDFSETISLISRQQCVLTVQHQRNVRVSLGLCKSGTEIGPEKKYLLGVIQNNKHGQEPDCSGVNSCTGDIPSRDALLLTGHMNPVTYSDCHISIELGDQMLYVCSVA